MPRANWGERGRALIAALPALMLPVIIVGGVKSGVFTMTESAAVAVAYALIVEGSKSVVIGDGVQNP